MERFIERCSREGREYRLSLSRLAKEAAAAQRSGFIPEQVRSLHGMNWVIGFAVDRTHSDVLLLGMHDPNRPLLDIDCLITAAKCVATGQIPACSLDPDGDPEFQKSVILGVDRRTRWAECMIEADYDMKRLAQGHDPRPIVRSYAGRKALVLNNSRGRRLASDASEVNRWWFTRSEQGGPPRSIILVEGTIANSADVLLIQRTPVVLLTEKEIRGEFGTGEVGNEAEQFATAFTMNMEKIGRRYRSIGELLALYRLLDVMVHLRELGKVPIPGEEFWLEEYQSPFEGPPERLPTLTRTVEWASPGGGAVYLHRMEVQGGVKMPLALDASPARAEPSSGLALRILGP